MLTLPTAKAGGVSIPDDVATPADHAAIAESQKDYERGETVSHSEINWD